MQVLKKITYYLFVFLLFAGSIANGFAQTSSAGYKVKAAFLFNFTQFVEWPATSFTTNQTPFVIGILGNDPFDAYLKEIIASENVKGHPIIIQQYNDPAEIKTCHILFINISQSSKLEAYIESIAKQGMLTVGDASSFIQKGGMIKFYEEDGKIKLQINPDVATKAGLTISSKLLKLAKT